MWGGVQQHANPLRSNSYTMLTVCTKCTVPANIYSHSTAQLLAAFTGRKDSDGSCHLRTSECDAGKGQKPCSFLRGLACQRELRQCRG